MKEGLDFAVKYPFSESARKAIEGIALTERIVELAVERIKKSLVGSRSVKMLLHETDKKEEVASFAAARMILGQLRNNFLTNRFAVNEAKKTSDYLGKEDEEIVNIVASQFGIYTKTEGKRTVIDLPTYVRFSVRDPHYRLINRKLYGGKVEINQNEKKRLIEEAVKKHNESIPLVKDPPELIKKAGERLIAEIPKSESKITVKIGDHPPCIMKLLEEAKKHQNLPHHARWYLATYLLAIGVSEDDITKLYADLPDFNEKITRYQVSHIKKKGYNVPSCATVMTYGLCCAVCRIGNPMNWHNLEEGRKILIKTRGE